MRQPASELAEELDERGDSGVQAFLSAILNPDCRAKLKIPPASTTGRTSPKGLKEWTFPVARTVTVQAFRSTLTSSPVLRMSHRRSTHSQGYSSPVATQFRKKIRAKLSAN